MAPVDRREHRQQRMRGTGSAAVETAFAFNLGALVRSAKQESLPPRPSPRKTPVQNTPKASNGSAQRHRSASFHRSSVARKLPTPPPKTVTPQLGKRKRGTKIATPLGEDDGQPDPLSPEIDGNVRSIEQSRRTAGPISPIPEGLDPMADELSLIGDMEDNMAKASGSTLLVEQAPMSVVSRNLMSRSVGSVPDLSPIGNRSERTPALIQQEHVFSVPRSSRHAVSAEPGPSTPADSLAPWKRHSSAVDAPHSRLTPAMNNVSDVDDGSEDELSPLQDKAHSDRQLRETVGPESHSGTQRSARKKTTSPKPSNDDDDGLDPLSPLADPPTNKSTLNTLQLNPTSATIKGPVPRKVGRPRKQNKISEAEEDIIQSSPPSSRPHPVSQKKPMVTREIEARDIDESSPDHERSKRGRKSKVNRNTQAVSKSISEHTYPKHPELRGEEEDSVQQSDEEGEMQPRLPKSRSQPKPKKNPRVEVSSDGPPKKRLKHGATQKITVMRLKGYGLSGITVVDTTRSAIETLLNNQMIKLTTKIESTVDSQQQRELRGQRNIILAYRDKLDDSLLELQDANNSAVDNVNKLRQYKKDKKRLQKEFLILQNEKDQLELQSDELAADFQKEKKETEDRHRLSSWMYDIQAAIKRGKDQAKKEGRENEGPDIPIKMLLDGVARDVGGPGGLLGVVKKFNTVLERSAGLLEGRA
ncbi:hypothetical protein B0J11DRAFT_534912 [Dendryphion nanum]|uniref:Inner kinetochore subunit AME1 domain-containing protein n=1 Tax=Dendryphion nanum TaxID=256645 RepID=A0A9P9DJA7_9PLEO|nr:hypothetical protein B0J11DRAFT_534912 [Dendryphion nanum]